MTLPTCIDCGREAVVFGDTRALCLECAFDRSMLRGDARSGSRYPAWLGLLALGSFVALFGGVAAVMVSPTPAAGAIFPLGVAGLWLTGKLARSTAEKPKRRRLLPYHVAAPTAPPRLGHFLQQDVEQKSCQR